ncbi:hypothetical protein [Pandoraea apista]|uniref:hypothetical protein n=1 Tax=Pandoraea apista TaxID=93218 RepID=UPI0012E20A98|nr:hypothetical protein [Pandoraea apista]
MILDAYSLQKFHVDQTEYQKRLVAVLPDFELSFSVGTTGGDTIAIRDGIQLVEATNADKTQQTQFFQAAKKVWADLMRATKTYPVNARERNFRVTVISTINGYTASVVERIASQEQPVALNVPLHASINPGSFYQHRHWFLKMLLEFVDSELMAWAVTKCDGEAGPGKHNAHILANLLGWPEGYPDACGDDLSRLQVPRLD